MIEPLSWEWRNEAEENPFRKGSTRPIKVTIHSSSFVDLGPDQTAALSLLRELAALGDIDILDTDIAAARRIEIGDPKPGRDYFDVQVWLDDQRGPGTYVPYPQQRLTTAQTLVSSGNRDEVQAALKDVVVVGAHNALHRDLLVTESKWIHHHRWRNVSRAANPRTILSSLKIIGLLLRSRDKYVFRAQRRSMLDLTKFSRSLYYSVLTRYRTPSMWRYYSACLASSERSRGDVPAMASSLMTRCQHALQARDLIAEAFFAPHDDAARDDTIYHFDYLTVLLVGALDAQARIARRVYGIAGDEPINFRREKFLNRLRDSCATELYELLTEPETVSLLTLLFLVRNTIHSASLSSHGYHTTGKGPGWLEIDEGKLATSLWDAAEKVSGAEIWGLKKFRHRLGDGPIVEPVQLVPYPYAAQLVHHGISLIDRISAATDVKRLFHGDVPALLDGPPDDDPIFEADTMNRIGLLG